MTPGRYFRQEDTSARDMGLGRGDDAPGLGKASRDMIGERLKVMFGPVEQPMDDRLSELVAALSGGEEASEPRP